jgi:ketosteroid isomerase-like protein
MTTAHSAEPVDVVTRFLTATKSLDVDAMFDEIGDDAVWSFPTGPTGAPRQVRGKQTNRAFFTGMAPMWTAFDLTFSHVHALVGDPYRVVAHYASTGSLIDGSPYTNTYLSLVTVQHGKITEWIEFSDPEPLRRGAQALQDATIR